MFNIHVCVIDKDFDGSLHSSYFVIRWFINNEYVVHEQFLEHEFFEHDFTDQVHFLEPQFFHVRHVQDHYNLVVKPQAHHIENDALVF